ncbi:RICIN domain-containing protein [Solwaraspora sp. WMMA2056]|uniref:glycoside hydrolase n=1 Tax=Solwaraspora sp. WMMA2056 TaxID=3015161 RepID=UPI00259B2DE0|nr:glycoside hydrolase [Solwaraspora sp. WMMA2056]WJK39214.1 RICIN domain-containing protein [Solwaraspora sp. WMMA2056]
MNRHSTTRRLATAVSAVIVGVSASVAGPAHAATDTSAASPGSTATADVDAAAVVTVRPDPAYLGQPFQGWGTSLVWFANATGDYPDEIRDELADLLFGDDGLNLNIARYNIGGGNAPDVPDYLRPGGAVPGWWQAPEGTTRTDRDWWNPDDPTHWNWAADPAQRWWVDRIKADVTHWETFSNSPPWFQTVSGYVSGGFDATTDQIRPDTVDDFATYLVRVTEHLEQAHGIDVATIDPLNEPNTPYWSTRLGPDGQPVGGRQEGAHAGPTSQQQVIAAVDAALRAAGSDTAIAAMDETNPGTFLTNWNAYSAATRARIAQLNVHTYGTGQRTAVRDLAKAEGKPLWMSEVEGSYGSGGQDFTSMLPGLGIARNVVDDLRELEPAAWVLWQPVEDYDNMAPGGEFPAGSNWGSIQVPFDCTATDTLQTCPIYTNTKFDTLRNFTHHIRPGDRLMAVDDPDSVAALATGKRATVVHVNATTAARTVRLDLSAFRTVTADATVTPVVTSADGALRTGTPVPVRDRAASLDVPAQSVTTFLIDGVSGVLLDETLIRDTHVYRLQGVPSGRSLTPSGSALVIRTDVPQAPEQLWQLTRLTDGYDNRARYTVGTVDGDRWLAVVDDTATLVDATGTPGPQAQWILSTTGDGTYTVVNVATGRLLDVGGQATNDGAAVSVWLPNSGANQRWRIIDERVVGLTPVELFTTPGVAPTLPATVVPVHPDGPRGALPVTWRDIAPVRWRETGTVAVTGRVVDAQGRTHLARATVVVDTLESTVPTRAKTFVGGTPDLPATVTATSSQGITVTRPVDWDTAPPGAFDEVGVVTLTGRADAGAGVTLPATVRVQVTAPVEATTPVAGVEASFTEPGYSTVGLTNGNLTDKAWSNWRSGTKNATDTLTVTLPREHTLNRVRVHFYRDGSDSYARSVTAQLRDGAGNWVDAGEPVTVPTPTPTAPVVDVPVTATTDAVRLLLTAHPDRHMTLSEIEVVVAAPGTSAVADAGSIAVDGVPLADFDPGRTQYAVPAGERPGQVDATPADPYADLTVTQAQPDAPTATVVVTSEDGTRTRTYRIDFQ